VDHGRAGPPTAVREAATDADGAGAINVPSGLRRPFARPGSRRHVLFPAERARILRLLVERVEVGPAGADIRLRVEGLAGLVRDLTAMAPEALKAAA
jgi:hypothetical protein